MWQVIKEKPEKPPIFQMKIQISKGGGGKSCCPFPPLPGIKIDSVLLIVAELKGTSHQVGKFCL